MKQRLFLLAILFSSFSCGGEEGLGAPDGLSDASRDAVGIDAPDLFGCGNDETIAPPKLECTGLYADWASKKIAPGVREFSPSTPLWSDGAEKRRWIYLPAGTTIDASSRTDWVFPVGTKFWKEFSVRGKRIETRLFKKLREDRWVTAAYAWSKDDTSTTSSPGGDLADVDTGGASYHIATQKECSDCHKGRRDRILGFEEVSLGGPNATGLNLAALVAEGRLSPPPPSVNLNIPDDGTGASTAALSWLHVNCGVTCHNRNSDATGNGTKMFLRLNPADFGTKPHSEWDIVQTTLRVTPITPAWAGQTRIVPGAPDSSLLVRLISSRGTEQMPPIGTHLIDQNNVNAVREWIRRMQPDVVDGGPSDAGVDARPDAGIGDDGSTGDAGAPDAGPPDVSEPDAGPTDDGAPDAGPPDVSAPDAGPPDAGPTDDASAPDAGADGNSDDAADAGQADGDNADGGNPADDGNADTAPPDDASDVDGGAPD